MLIQNIFKAARPLIPQQLNLCYVLFLCVVEFRIHCTNADLKKTAEIFILLLFFIFHSIFLLFS